jgi:hypothetical protein
LRSGDTAEVKAATADVERPFLSVLHRVPRAQLPEVLSFIPRQRWDHPVARRADLPVPDWSAFIIHESTDLFDLRDWQPFTPGIADLVSPVLVEGEIVASKRRAADHFRVAFGTEGTALVAACMTAQPYQIEMGPASGVVKTNLITEAHLIIDVRRYAIGEPFRLTIRGIMWNGLLPDDPWVNLVSLADGGRGKIVVEAPRGLPVWNVGFFKYPDGKEQAVRAEGEGTQLVAMDGHRILWEISTLKGNCVYEIQWSFKPTAG